MSYLEGELSSVARKHFLTKLLDWFEDSPEFPELEVKLWRFYYRDKEGCYIKPGFSCRGSHICFYLHNEYITEHIRDEDWWDIFPNMPAEATFILTKESVEQELGISTNVKH